VTLNSQQFGSTGTLKGYHSADCGYAHPPVSGERELDPSTCLHCANLKSARVQAEVDRARKEKT
jgi:hypothetical protein